MANTKDITIRITGQNLAGSAITGVQKQLNELLATTRKTTAGFSNVGGSVGAALDAESRRIAKLKDTVSGFNSWIRSQGAGLGTSTVAARAVSKRDKWMETFLNPEESARGWQRWGSSSELAFARAGNASKGFAEKTKKAWAGLGLGLALAGDFMGAGATQDIAPPSKAELERRFLGRALSAGGNVAGQAALGGIAGGPLTAAAFGGYAAVNEMRQMASESKQHADNRERAARAARAERDSDLATQVAGARAIGQTFLRDPGIAGTRRQLEEQSRILNTKVNRASLFKLNPQGIRQTARARNAIDKEVERLIGVQALSELLNISAHGAIEGGRGLSNSVEGGFGAVGGFLAPRLKAFQKFMIHTQDQLRISEAAETPAETLQRNLNQLEGKKAFLSPELYAKARQSLWLGAAAGVDKINQAPGLAATEGRFLTRGRDRNDEVSDLHKTLKDAHKKEQEQLKALLEELKKKGALVTVGHAR